MVGAEILNPLPQPRDTASDSIAPMPEQQRLRQMLDQLHSELQRAPAADDRSRELLERVLSDLQNLLDVKHPEKRAASIVDRLRELVGTFEETIRLSAGWWTPSLRWGSDEYEAQTWDEVRTLRVRGWPRHGLENALRCLDGAVGERALCLRTSRAERPKPCA